jgi:hypothetical protein
MGILARVHPAGRTNKNGGHESPPLRLQKRKVLIFLEVHRHIEEQVPAECVVQGREGVALRIDLIAA